MRYDYSKLRGRIVEKCRTQSEFSKRIGMTEKTVSNKLTGVRAFSQLDIEKAVKILGLKRGDILEYFFTENKETMPNDERE